MEYLTTLTEWRYDITNYNKNGIIGKKDSGKTTLALSLLNLYHHSEGSILIDGINIMDIGIHDLRNKITLITKDPVLLAGTLRMNLDPYEVCSDKDLWDVLEVVNLSNLVRSLYKELSFEFDIGGKNLSVGTRQLICLARALIRNSKIILLDDPVSSDGSIYDKIKNSFSHCTILIISHNFRSVLDCSR